MTCKDRILSEEYADFLTDYVLTEEREGIDFLDYCYHRIDSGFGVVYVERESLPALSVGHYGYQQIPQLYGLMETTSFSGSGEMYNAQSLVETGSIRVQEPPLSLLGEGVIIGIIDTGIRYENPVFRREDGSSRIVSIWDQTIQDGQPPEGFLYGTEYTGQEIDRALRNGDARQLVPSTDENGHGTATASVAAASITDEYFPFRGAAPKADIAVVKLKPAKQYLRDFYLVKDDVPAFQENDIMEAVSYLQRMAIAFNRPVVIVIGVGTSLGSHDGTSPLARYLNVVAGRRSRTIVVAAGNEGDKEHHFQGNAPEIAEVRVAGETRGFCMEIWGNLPDTYVISIRTPGGETTPVLDFRNGIDKELSFVFENTRITASIVLVEPNAGEQLIFLRFVNPTPGIWSIKVLSESLQQGEGLIHMWLPLAEFLDTPVSFLVPNPNVTLTEPSCATRVITVSAYDGVSGAWFPASGRGFTRSNLVKPDLAAPGVNVSTILGKRTGTAYAAALTAGCVAQFVEWAIVKGNARTLESRGIKSYLIKGTTRDGDFVYPDRRFGYGKLNIEGTFEALAGR